MSFVSCLVKATKELCSLVCPRSLKSNPGCIQLLQPNLRKILFQGCQTSFAAMTVECSVKTSLITTQRFKLNWHIRFCSVLVLWNKMHIVFCGHENVDQTRAGCFQTRFLFNFSVHVTNKNFTNMNSVQQQYEHHGQKVLIKSFHLSGHTFRFHWTVQDLEVFLVQSNSPLAVKESLGI